MYRYENITVWSSEALEDWYEFTSIGVHGCLMVELEILVFEAGYFLCGTFDAVSVGVFGAVYILIFYTFMICSGVASALAIRIGYSLGVNESGQAKVSMQVAFILCWVYAVITSIVIFSCQNYIGYIFTNDKEVIDGIAKIAPLLIIFEISDLTSNIAKGAVQGCGRQGAGALIAFIAYYFIGLPLCVYLVLFQKQKAEGMWIGLCVGNGLQATFFLIYTLSINWEKEASLSQERIRLTRSGETIRHNSNAVLMGKDVETMLNDNNGIMLNDLNQKESEETSPLVGSFHLNRRTIYVRMMNYGTALVVCVVGISIYLL
ncbi:multidrug and toxin extrusion protein 1-like [Antedon mediterranea]|uniref:multidrug and toxin extrusion protein 1-like n=1 Tax=Antedon mediterranea TaxID=105859 RepID=UPI003AF58F4F